jgi:hypothetical protein
MFSGVIMALFFNLQTLETQSLNDANKFMAMLEYHYSKRLPSKYSKYLPSKVPLNGTSYLLNPLALFNDKSTDILYKLQYIKLAGRRDYSLYKLYKYKALQLSYYPDIIYDTIKHNPLLTITSTEITFKYEEI